MKLTVRHLGVRSTDALDSWVEDRIFALQPHLRIDEALVRLERRPSASPPYRAHVQLVTPGPDIVADGADHTLPAAIGKVMDHLEEKLAAREVRSRRRTRSNLHAPVARARNTRRN